LSPVKLWEERKRISRVKCSASTTTQRSRSGLEFVISVCYDIFFQTSNHCVNYQSLHGTRRLFPAIILKTFSTFVNKHLLSSKLTPPLRCHPCRPKDRRAVPYLSFYLISNCCLIWLLMTKRNIGGLTLLQSLSLSVIASILFDELN